MLIAHLPAGYIVGRAFGARRGAVMAAALAGSVLPDFDMIWFWFIDNGAIHHHRYWVHVPGFWAGVAVVLLPVVRLVAPAFWWPAVAFFASLLVHAVVDSIGGGIMWLWPFDHHLYSLVEVPAAHGHWIASFMLHWTFMLELGVIGVAGWLWLKR
jgi:inner membrane protein